MFRCFADWFWNEDIWLPPGVQWSALELAHSRSLQLPQFSDLYLSLYCAFAFLFIRAAFEWLIARPLGFALGIRDGGSSLPHLFACIIHRCRKVWLVCNNGGGYYKAVAANGHVQSSSTSATAVPEIIQVILHKTTLDKFSESCWRFAYYLGIFCYGLCVLWNKPWFGDTAYCWYGYPFHNVDPEIRWYYLIELSFYWSLMLSQFVDTVRKDFWVNFIHHITTVLLMSFSWASNFVRVGTLVLIVHDAADFWLEGFKMARYCRSSGIANVLFVVFAFVWFVTRCGYYPLRIIYSTTVEAPSLIHFFPVYYIFNSLLLILLVLQIIWTVMIVRVAVNAIRSGETDDVRSDDENCENGHSRKSAKVIKSPSQRVNTAVGDAGREKLQ